MSKSKLIYRTKLPKKGFIFNESYSTHEGGDKFDPLPPNEVQEQALKLVDEAMRGLAQKLDKLGYDPTKIRFQIHCK